SARRRRPGRLIAREPSWRPFSAGGDEVMRSAHELLSEPKLAAAVDELKSLISSRYPTTTYEVTAGEDPDGLFVTTTGDVHDPDTVVDLFIDRLLELEIDEGLPLYVIPIRTPERRAAIAKPGGHSKIKTMTERRRKSRSAV